MLDLAVSLCVDSTSNVAVARQNSCMEGSHLLKRRHENDTPPESHRESGQRTPCFSRSVSLIGPAFASFLLAALFFTVVSQEELGARTRVETFRVGQYPQGMAFDGTNIWIPCLSQDSLPQ